MRQAVVFLPEFFFGFLFGLNVFNFGLINAQRSALGRAKF
jgi:hypothetical protein